MNNEHGSNTTGPGKDKVFEIVVNGRPQEVTAPSGELTFLEVVRLAFPEATINDTTVYTVTYKRGRGEKPEGTMVNGDTVKLKSGMIFNVTPTDKS
ncbi:MAG: hypothetical protein D4S02_01145 [Rhodocyclaceae bacterium]|nr:MAG: hypothetical protein D4S02_01145 [Rhodocyclaceae bacterium]